VRLTADELAHLDEMHDGNRAAFIRRLLHKYTPSRAGGGDEPTHIEALRLLAQSARDGSVTARVALERALRASSDDQSSSADVIPDWLQ
jgi:hypothetical protein